MNGYTFQEIVFGANIFDWLQYPLHKTKYEATWSAEYVQIPTIAYIWTKGNKVPFFGSLKKYYEPPLKAITVLLYPF